MKQRTYRTWIPLLFPVLACSPDAETGECGVNDPCERGSVCDLEHAICMETGAPTDATESPAPSDFTNKVVPFFRGEVCYPLEAQAGTAFPVQLTPCLHPCVRPRSFQFKHSWTCLGSECEGYALMWVTADAADDGCPEDAFGAFDASLCAYAPTTELTMRLAYDDETPVEGTLSIEIPFLSNEDAEAIAAAPSDEQAEVIAAKIQQYPQDPARMPEPGVALSADTPPPAASCSDAGASCECVKIGL